MGRPLAASRARCWPVREGTCRLPIPAHVPPAPRPPDAGGAKDSGGETPPASCTGLDECTCFVTGGCAPITAACWCPYPQCNSAGSAAAVGLSAALRRQIPIVRGRNSASRLFAQPSLARPSMVCARGPSPNVSANALPRCALVQLCRLSILRGLRLLWRQLLKLLRAMCKPSGIASGMRHEMLAASHDVLDLLAVSGKLHV
jgi:hypothetical protein